MTRIMQPTPTIGHAPSHTPPDMTYAPGLGLARALGWFSIGLGIAEAFAPKQMKRLTGVESTGLLQLYGLREIATGVGILSSTNPAPWVWGRVAGDLVDLATLGTAFFNADCAERVNASAASAAVGGVMVLDAVCAGVLTAATKLQG